MTAPYDESVQKEWKERKEKIEDYYRDMGKVGTTDNKKISSISVVKSGDKSVAKIIECSPSSNL